MAENMVKYTEDEKAAISKYLVDAARKQIANARVGNVDVWARYFVHELETLGSIEDAREIYDYYHEIWGQPQAAGGGE